jgi:acetoin utilization deacetylase AcuC-like enzyme
VSERAGRGAAAKGVSGGPSRAGGEWHPPRKMRLFYSPAYVMTGVEFDTTRKAAWVADSLAERPIEGVELVAPEPLTEDALAAAHDPSYVRAVRTGEPLAAAASNGLGWDPALYPTVAASNGGAVAAALHALRSGGAAGSLSSGLHHARADEGAGFCTFNGLALGVRAAMSAGAARVLVLDLDAHCGGGTHSILRADAGVTQVDVAVSGFDPYTPSRPWTLDLVSRAGDYLPTIRRRLEELDRSGERFDLVLYNAGMDPFEGSAVGGLDGIDHAMLAEREGMVFDWARGCGRPIAFVLAGGYASGEEGRAQLVELHRETILAAWRVALSD